MKIKICCLTEFTDINGVMDEVVRVENETWPEEIRAPRAKFESRAAIFPEGFLLGFADGKLWGVATAEVINFNPAKPCASWEKITDNGWIKKSHTSDGNALYVISIGVSPFASRRGIGSALLAAEKRLLSQLSLKWLVLGSRLPGFAAWHQQNSALSVSDYLLSKNEKGENIDPLIRFYERAGLGVIKIVPKYMEDDPESEDYGVVMAWQPNNDRGK